MTGRSLLARFDAVVCDLDGVVYTGDAAVPHAVDALNAADIPIVYATNNASRAPGEVGQHLRSLGVTASDDAVLTSARAAAHHLAGELARGTPVLAVGGRGVAASLRAVGLDARVPGDGERVSAVLQGYGREVTAGDLAAAAAAIRYGARWVATNDDLTMPTEDGPAPGNGSLVAAVRAAVDVDPLVIGKPHRPLYALAAERVHGEPSRVLALGDRLETDIAGARATGMPGGLVLTGVHGLLDAASASPDRRPTYVLGDLRDLHRPYPEHRREDEWHRRGAAAARVGDALESSGEGIDAARAALDAVWAAVDVGRLGTEDVSRLWSAGTVGRSRHKE